MNELSSEFSSGIEYMEIVLNNFFYLITAQNLY